MHAPDLTGKHIQKVQIGYPFSSASSSRRTPFHPSRAPSATSEPVEHATTPGPDCYLDCSSARHPRGLCQVLYDSTWFSAAILSASPRFVSPESATPLNLGRDKRSNSWSGGGGGWSLPHIIADVIALQSSVQHLLPKSTSPLTNPRGRLPSVALSGWGRSPCERTHTGATKMT